MKTPVLLGFIAFFGICGSLAVAEEKSSVPSGGCPLQKILDGIEKEIPGFRKSLSPEDLKRAEEAYLAALGKGIRPARKEPRKKSVLPQKKRTFEKALFPADGRFAVLRFEELSEKNVSVMDESLKARKRQTAGAVLDLRSCSEGTPAGAAAAQKMLSGRLPGRLPVMILISGKTAGAGELLAARLQKKHRAMTLGKRTAFEPCGYRTVRIGDRFWEIPVLNDILPAPVEPMIECPENESMRRALELLASLDSVIPANQKTKGVVP